MGVIRVRFTFLYEAFQIDFSAITRFVCDEDIANQTFCSDITDKSVKNITLGYLKKENISEECDKFTVDLQNHNLVPETLAGNRKIGLPALIAIIVSSLLLLLAVIVGLVFYGNKRRKTAIARPKSVYRLTKKDLEEEEGVTVP